MVMMKRYGDDAMREAAAPPDWAQLFDRNQKWAARCQGRHR